MARPISPVSIRVKFFRTQPEIADDSGPAETYAVSELERGNTCSEHGLDAGDDRISEEDAVCILEEYCTLCYVDRCRMRTCW